MAVVVDVANVMGSRPDGWWRDRAGAAARLCREISALADRGIQGLDLAGFVLVLEGRAREASEHAGNLHPLVRVVLADGPGDDSIAAEAGSLASAGKSCLVVTADRELRRRCERAGAAIEGPGWLLRLLLCCNIKVTRSYIA